ncbi:MAG TPA: hypothetical protein DEQ20_10640 [Desulfobulbaceae bacterium]|nr:MAG: hypothetical protein A2520_06515 [Deltaproteobacteria bacterium RIFOXYD12_FULL_53_23]HCC55359.1 hypothetical protein [Desulfobulbaceae bacterium]
MNKAPTNFLQYNTALLQQHRPELLSWIGSPLQEPAGFAIVVSQDGRPNIEALHPVTHTQELVHDLAHIQESFPSLLELLATEQDALIFLVGMGLSYEATLLLRKCPKLRLVIFEPNAALFAAALKVVDLSPVLICPNVSLHVGKDINIQQLLQQEDDASRALPMHLVSHQKLLELFPETYGPIYNNLQNELLLFKGKLQTIVAQGPLLFRNTVANVPQLIRSVSVQALKDIAQVLPAVCVAAGPSLTKNVDLLKGQENKVFIIAVDSAAKILIDHGITPHIILTVDPIPASMTKLRNVIDTHAELPLAWTPDAFPETVQGFKNGPKFVIPGVNDLFRLYLDPLFAQESPFAHMLSVTHAATQLATVAGCNPLIFIGLDLALSGEKDHADGCPVSWGNLDQTDRIKIPAWDGGEVETVAVLKNQLLALQSIISHNSEMRFIDATEGGALIPGTEVMLLHEALSRYADKGMAFDIIIANVFKKAKKPSLDAAIHALVELQKLINTSHKTAREGLRNGKEAYLHWRLSQIPNKKVQALKKFKKTIVASGNAFDKLMELLDLTNALYPLRATAHHEFIYARKIFNNSAQEKTPEQRVIEELEQNIAYFTSWIATTKEAETIISPVIKEMSAHNGKGK